MNTKTLTFLAVVCGLFAAHTTHADDRYIAPAVIYTGADSDRLVDDEITGGEIAIGEFLSDRFALEGRLGLHGMSGADDLDLVELGFHGLWAFQRDHRISPYLLFGGGLIDADSELLGDGLSPFLSAGAGLNFKLTDGPISARLEYRLRKSFEGSHDPMDDLISLGLVIPFGKKDEPMPAPVAVAAAPEPAPEPEPEPEPDSDADGVVDRLDDCPDTAEGVRVDVKGCEIRDVIELPGVNFETNSDRLLPGSENILRDAAATLQKYPDLVVEVAGHTDSAGAADYNQGLSERRAATVRDYLITAGAPEDNLSARGYGESSPIADNGTAEGRATNRRVELRIIEQ